MKKLLKNEICGSGNSVQDPYVAENWLKSQTFRLKKKKGRNTNVRLGSAFRTLTLRDGGRLGLGGAMAPPNFFFF